MPVMDHCLHDGPSCTTILVVRDPVSKGLSKFSMCPTTDRHTHDGLSCTTVMMVRDPSDKGLSKSYMFPTTDSYDGPSYRRRSVVSVRRRTLGKCWDTLSRGVSDHHDGLAGRIVVGMTVRRTRPFEDT